MKEGGFVEGDARRPGLDGIFGGYRWNRLAGLKDIRSGSGLSVTSYG